MCVGAIQYVSVALLLHIIIPTLCSESVVLNLSFFVDLYFLTPLMLAGRHLYFIFK